MAWTPADRWAERYEAEGGAGTANRSSRPHSSPARTDPATRVLNLTEVSLT